MPWSCPTRVLGALLLVLAPARAAPTGNRYLVSARNAPVGPFLAELAAKEGVALRYPPELDLRITLEMAQASFREVVGRVCDSHGLRLEAARDGDLRVGLPEDFQAGFPGEEPAERTQIAYRCRNLDSETLAGSLTQTFPGLKCFAGPRFKSPAVEPAASGTLGGGFESTFGPSAGNSLPGPNTLPSYAVGPLPQPRFPGGAPPGDRLRQDVILSGPGREVRQGLAFARILDRPRQQVRINVSITELTATASRDLGIDWTFSGQAGGPPAVTLAENPGPGATAAGNPRLKLGSFSHSPAQVALTLQALESKGLVKTLANPSLMVMDGEKCSILIGERRLYPKQTGTNVQGGAVFDVAELRTGVMLQLAVQISQNNEVTFYIYPQDSYQSGVDTILGSSYPVISTREIQTTVHLKSGAMLVVGGLKVDQDGRSSRGVPFISRIPLIGPLFGSRSKSSYSKELVIMVQPEILDEAGPGTSRITAEPAA